VQIPVPEKAPVEEPRERYVPAEPKKKKGFLDRWFSKGRHGR